VVGGAIGWAAVTGGRQPCLIFSDASQRELT
jgi:hypothetical protein